MNSPNVEVPMVNYATNASFSRVTSGNLEVGKYYIARGGYVFMYDGEDGTDVLFKGPYPLETPVSIVKARVDGDLQDYTAFPVFKPNIALPATNLNTAFIGHSVFPPSMTYNYSMGVSPLTPNYSIGVSALTPNYSSAHVPAAAVNMNALELPPPAAPRRRKTRRHRVTRRYRRRSTRRN